MDVKITEEANWRRIVDVTATQDELRPEFEKALKKLQKNLKLEGFRRGKVPMNMVRRLYGQRVEIEAIEDILPSLFAKAARQENLKVVTRASVEDLQYQPGTDLNAKFSVEVEPEFELKKLENFKLEKQIYAVDEEDIQHELERIQESQALWEVTEDAATEKDFVTADLQVVDQSGVPVIGEKFEGETIALSQKSGEVNEFGRQLNGVKAGDVRTIFMTPPPQEGDDKPQEQVQYEVTIKEVKRRILPTIDDDLAKDLGDYESLDALKEEIRKSISDSVQKRFDDSLERSLIDEIIKNNSFEVPEGMVKSYLDNLIDVFSVGDSYVIDETGVLFGHIGDHFDFTAGDVVDVIADIPQYHHPQSHFLYHTAFVGYLHHITDSNLIFEQNEESRNYVFDQILGAKAYCQSDHTGASQNRSYLYAELFQYHHAGYGYC